MFKRLRASIRDGFARAFPMVDPFMMVGPDPGQCAVSTSAPPAPVGGVPAGWKLVPVDMTDEMVRAAQEARRTYPNIPTIAAYHAALASAPPAPTPEAGRDLAAQGEPVAWRVGSHYNIHVYDGDRPVATFHSAEDAARAVAAVNVAPAPSRPADREEIARWRNDAFEKAAAIVRRYEPFADDAVRDILALRDAPRDGGDGWLPIETAPKDGTLIGVGGGCAIWNDNGGFWHTAVGRDYGRRIQWKVTHWKNLDPATIPPSPNAGDGTRDTQPGAVEHRSV